MIGLEVNSPVKVIFFCYCCPYQFLFINIQADREGYIAIMMPKPADWLKVKASLVDLQEYKKVREIS